MIEISPGITVSEHELAFSFERSSGPGGQNVNKVNTRVTLHFDLNSSTSLSTTQKNQLKKNLASRIGQDGILRLHSSKERTQLANRRAAVNRFIDLLAEAFKVPKMRKPTSIPVAAQKKRLEEKTQRSTVKRSRRTELVYDD
jgi:ribosome-associated protein